MNRVVFAILFHFTTFMVFLAIWSWVYTGTADFAEAAPLLKTSGERAGIVLFTGLPWVILFLITEVHDTDPQGFRADLYDALFSKNKKTGTRDD